jgi:two-component system response regulator FixJ
VSEIKPVVQIVDDDASFLTATSRLLRASGFAVQTYSSASDFLAQRNPDVPGCVVADLQMPEINGLDLQAALAQTDNPPPLLFLTGHGDIPSTVRAMRGGAVDFLEKRAPKEKLLDAVKRALARDVPERDERARQRELRARFDALSERELEVLPCRAGQTQQADRRRSWYPRADGEAAPHGDHQEIARAVRCGTHAADARGGHFPGVHADLP